VFAGGGINYTRKGILYKVGRAGVAPFKCMLSSQRTGKESMRAAKTRCTCSNPGNHGGQGMGIKYDSDQKTKKNAADKPRQCQK